jgi:hypothetical protein
MQHASMYNTGRLARDDFIFRKRWPLLDEVPVI